MTPGVEFGDGVNGTWELPAPSIIPEATAPLGEAAVDLSSVKMGARVGVYNLETVLPFRSISICWITEMVWITDTVSIPSTSCAWRLCKLRWWLWLCC